MVRGRHRSSSASGRLGEPRATRPGSTLTRSGPPMTREPPSASNRWFAQPSRYSCSGDALRPRGRSAETYTCFAARRCGTSGPALDAAILLLPEAIYDGAARPKSIPIMEDAGGRCRSSVSPSDRSMCRGGQLLSSTRSTA